MRSDSANEGNRVCCICGKELPNRFGVAGVCGAPGCMAELCALHWNRGNRRCKAHGYEAVNPLVEENKVNEQREGRDNRKSGEAMKQALGRLGSGAVSMLKRLRKDRSPGAVIAAMDEQLRATKERKEHTAAEIDRLHGEIVSRKKLLEKGSRARREILEEELKSLLVAYDSAKRAYKIMLENERNMQLVKGRLVESGAYTMSTVSEDLIDDVIDRLDESAGEAEAIADAARDLERAGKRRERESDSDQLLEALEAFDEDETWAEEPSAEDGDMEPARQVARRDAAGKAKTDDGQMEQEN